MYKNLFFKNNLLAKIFLIIRNQCFIITDMNTNNINSINIFINHHYSASKFCELHLLKTIKTIFLKIYKYQLLPNIYLK